MQFYSFFFDENEGLIIPDNEIPRILCFKGNQDGSGYHFLYNILDTFEILTRADDEEKIFVGDYPFDLSALKQLFYNYFNVIEY